MNNEKGTARTKPNVRIKIIEIRLQYLEEEQGKAPCRQP